MNKLEIAEYLRKLYGMPVTKVHTANYDGKEKRDPRDPTKRQTHQPRPPKTAAYKKAFVYLADEQGAQRPRYHEVEAQLTPEALASWPAKPGLSARELREQAERAGREG
ncbi:hypothetical protein EMIHUDRAFT_314013 [Emiliania huxleyi CCMP1516]|uniref:Large ribosomal subunit protein uL23m n=2 Tax=Emiliania huxleyi TaxID=2903 RepID=A0A0D3KCN7_EMIH1|nr:hypothetical protein EMIHUDRAFT_314013 [Emiliania huxleyi CCMP1516]EOD33522.1 hypothetical protein EMIHUDRAFT_314013 [Emiliania huxleyi CCMP1516]|eukprot:XP_005785951.1 hypothetical protein EMIHUDRAFT_314013 [Emiliania huxleyi CCMP1516]